MPIADYTDRAFAAVLSFYQLGREMDIGKAVKRFRAQIMNLQEDAWKKLAKAVENVDAGKS